MRMLSSRPPIIPHCCERAVKYPVLYIEFTYFLETDGGCVRQAIGKQIS